MYQALYRKYRPQSFDDVVGQTVITTTLKNQLITGKLSHAYLFTGSHGTGKTTCAKIMAKAVNCENPVDGNPCNCCPACRGIDAGSILDVQEIDAASNNGVDNVRAIRDDAVYPPAEVKKRVYIIDEVHMLSPSAFNALLKTIEEPPEHLMFILATTELNKVPATILSRCQRFAFRRPTAEDITGRIQYVAYQEGISITEDAAELLGRLAGGAFRDGLSLLDQCASASVGTLDVEGVYRTLGLAGQQQTAAMMAAIGDRDTAQALKLFSELYSEGKDAGAMLDELSTLARDMLVLKTAPKSGLSMISSTCTTKELRDLSPKFTSEELLRIIDLISATAAGFKTSANQRIDGELCLIHLCQPDLSREPEDLSARLSRMETDLTARILELEQKLRNGDFVARTAEEEAPPPWDDRDAPPEPDAEPPEPQPNIPPDENWRKIKERVLPELSNPAKSFVEKNLAGYLRGDELLLIPDQTFARNMLKQFGDWMEPLKKAATLVMGRPIRVRMGETGVVQSDDKLRDLSALAAGFDNIIIHN
jgi:DNA polymerase-3 subunit gamma/tau